MTHATAYHKATVGLAWLSGYLDPALNPEGISHLRLIYLQTKISELAQEARDELEVK